MVSSDSIIFGILICSWWFNPPSNSIDSSVGSIQTLKPWTDKMASSVISTLEEVSVETIVAKSSGKQIYIDIWTLL